MKKLLSAALIIGVTACSGVRDQHVIRASRFIQDPNAPIVKADAFVYDTNAPEQRASQFLFDK